MFDTNFVGFPGLGIEPFEINPTALSIGQIRIQWYGIIIVMGMILACLYAFYRMKGLGLVLDNMLDIAIVCIPCGIVGARLYYVFTSLDEFGSFAEVFQIWNGGLAIYGGIIGGLIGVISVCAVKKYKCVTVLDCIAPGVMLAQAVGRWGNFMNAEAFGSVVKYDFLTVPVDASMLASHPFMMTVNGNIVHPTFLYESVWNIIGFLIINAFFKHRKYDGQILIMYLAWYGLGRSIIEGFRADSLYVGDIRISQLLAFLCFVSGVILLIVFAFVRKKEKKI